MLKKRDDYQMKIQLESKKTDMLLVITSGALIIIIIIIIAFIEEGPLSHLPFEQH